MHLRRVLSLFFVASIAATPLASAQSAASFTDVSSKDPAFAAIEFMKSRGVMSGNPDGTFKPNDTLTRAAAAKILVLIKISDGEAKGVTDKTFGDIPENAWYRPYAEAARKLGIVGAASSFNGERPVKKAEFLKMLLSALGNDPGAFGEIQLPLADDVTDSSAWYYPWMRRGITNSLIQVNSKGLLEPDIALTRANAAQIMYFQAMYDSGKRSQALLSEEETELVNVMQFIEQKSIDQAERASARALLASRGALQSKPDIALVQAAVKTAEAFRALVRAYRAGTESKLDDALALAKDAWALAEKARQLSPGLAELSDRVQAIAKMMADQARALKGAPVPAQQ